MGYTPRPAPGGPQEWFTLLQSCPLLGLILLDLGDLVNYALVGLVFFALFGALQEARRSSMLISLGACFAGITVTFASNPAFAMLSLSRQYEAATEAQRAGLAAAAMPRSREAGRGHGRNDPKCR